MKKQLEGLTEDEAKKICEAIGEPYIKLYVFDRTGDYPIIQINTTSTLNGSRDDSSIWIYRTGKVLLYRNNGDWGGSRYESINTLPVTDYLRSQGYEFIY